MVNVVCVGSATWDIFLKSDEFKIDQREEGVYLCEKYEGKIEAQELVMASGGGATNAAVSYARKGIKAAAVVEMGKDVVAGMIAADLAKEGVDTSWIIQEENEVTAVSVILLSGKGSSIVTYRGASRMLTEADVLWERLESELEVGGWIHLTSVGGDMEVASQLIDWARERQRKVYWNPGGEEIEKIKNEKLKIKNWPDVLQMNRGEASKFYCPTPAETVLMITDGARGGRVCYGGSCFWYDAVQTTVVDSTGAGDAFGSGVVAGLLRDQNITEAVELGKKQAAAVVSQIGAKAGLLRHV